MKNDHSSQMAEREDWQRFRNDSRPQVHIDNLINKFTEAGIFAVNFEKYLPLLKGPKIHLLEIGGGECWASCLLKTLHPELHATGTDLSPDAVMGAEMWGALLETRLDNVYAASADQLAMIESGSVDIIFCFQAAHHFPNQTSVLREAYRVLRVGGTVLYLYEPLCSGLFNFVFSKLRLKRGGIPEDFINPVSILRSATELGFSASCHPSSYCARGPLSFRTVLKYNYFLLSCHRPFRYFMPFWGNLVFKKTFPSPIVPRDSNVWPAKHGNSHSQPG